MTLSKMEIERIETVASIHPRMNTSLSKAYDLIDMMKRKIWSDCGESLAEFLVEYWPDVDSSGDFSPSHKAILDNGTLTLVEMTDTAAGDTTDPQALYDARGVL